MNNVWILTVVLNGVTHFYGQDPYGDWTLWRGKPTEDWPVAVMDQRTGDQNLWMQVWTMADYTPWDRDEVSHLR